MTNPPNAASDSPRLRSAVTALRAAQGQTLAANSAGAAAEAASQRQNAYAQAFNVMRYPSEIGQTNLDFPHYTMFFITKRLGDVPNREVIRKFKVDVSNSHRPDLNVEAGKIAFETGLIVGGVQAGVSFVKKVATTFGGKAGIISTGTGGAAGGGAAGLLSQDDRIETLTENRERVYLKDVVALYMSDKPSASYKAYWKDADIGSLASKTFLDAAAGLRTAISELGAGDFVDGGKRLVESAMTAIKGAGPAATAYFMKNANKSPLGILGGIEELASSSLGVAINPFTVQLFKNMGFRTFTFSYVFLPKNKFEYTEAQKIIRTFKKYMHPTRNQATGGVFLGYPAEFEIQYFYRNQENTHLFKIASCALTDLKVEYGGADFTTFRELPGAPAEMTLQLSFTELEILTADRIEQGY